jgi:putative hemolysin
LITEIAFLLFLVVLNAFFAASEIALISLNDNKLRIMADNGDKKSKLIQSLLKEPGKFLATIQIGITLAGFLASAFASESFSYRIVAFFKQYLTSVPEAWLKTISMIVVTILLSFVTLVLGELVPKRLAMKKADAIARFVAVPLNFLYKCTSPFVALLSFSTNSIVRLFGVNPHEEDGNVTEEEIRMMVSVGEEKGTIDESEKQMINNIFEFNNKDAADIMTHRIQIVSLPITASIEEVSANIKREQYSRIPVYQDSIDNIKGILHTKDLLNYMTEHRSWDDFVLANIIREPVFVPATRRIDQLFKDMQASQAHMAVIIDEYGGTAGKVTIEDILEEIVGNIQDEYDDEEEEIVHLGDNEYFVDGTLNLYALRDYFSYEFPVDDYDTIGGFTVGLLDKIPSAGENASIEWGPFIFTVAEIEDKRVSKVKITRKTDEQTDETLV